MGKREGERKERRHGEGEGGGGKRRRSVPSEFNLYQHSPTTFSIVTRIHPAQILFIFVSQYLRTMIGRNPLHPGDPPLCPPINIIIPRERSLVGNPFLGAFLFFFRPVGPRLSCRLYTWCIGWLLLHESTTHTIKMHPNRGGYPQDERNQVTKESNGNREWVIVNL